MLFVRFYCLSELQQFTRLMLAGSGKKLKNNSRDNPETKRTVSIFSLKLRHCLIKLRKDTRQHFFYIFIKFKQRSHKFKLMLAGDDTRSYIKNLASRVLNRKVFMCPYKTSSTPRMKHSRVP